MGKINAGLAKYLASRKKSSGKSVKKSGKIGKKSK